ncbi:MAG: chorismate mutase [Termitinemataceae bacterium]|nr:MAG: chorismate mutase [Termitinemataceae bacterium]
MKKLFAIRGATQCKNEAQDIKENISTLYDALISANGLCEDDIVSLQFSITSDLTAANPAQALRESGRGANLSLFCSQEPLCVNSLPRTVRFLLHCYLDEGFLIKHIYQNGAEVLRPDRRM